MRHLKTISAAMTLLGAAAVVASIALDLDATIIVIGMMLAVAGVIKVAMIGLWHAVAGVGAPVNAESPGIGTSEERRR